MNINEKKIIQMITFSYMVISPGVVQFDVPIGYQESEMLTAVRKGEKLSDAGIVRRSNFQHRNMLYHRITVETSEYVDWILALADRRPERNRMIQEILITILVNEL